MPRLMILLYRALGAAIAIGLMQAAGQAFAVSPAQLPFVTSIVLVMALPDSDAARPTAIIGGHGLSTLCGLICALLVGHNQTSNAVAVGAATLAMMAGRVVHPPAGIDAFLIPSQELSAQWAFVPIIGSVVLAIYAKAWRGGEMWLEHMCSRGFTSPGGPSGHAEGQED